MQPNTAISLETLCTGIWLNNTVLKIQNLDINGNETSLFHSKFTFIDSLKTKLFYSLFF